MPESAAARPGHDPYAALRLPEFRRFISARALFVIATRIQGLVVSWQLFKLTGDPWKLGLIGLTEAIPSIAVSLYAGHLADSVRRKNIIMSAVAVLLLCAGALALLASPYGLELLKDVRLGTLPIYAVIFVSGIARGFLGPALFSFMPQLLPDREKLANAITWNSTTWQGSSVLGPVIGGYLIAHLGVASAYTVSTVLLMLTLLMFGSIASRPLPVQVGARLDFRESILTGLQFIFSNQLVLAALSLDLFAVLFGGRWRCCQFSPKIF
ncbi:MFS transporter [Hymenobacter sp. J193]|uniref:MFS transporter n=1 Tax=Hymenobacter sp. J193 TaxID=2898429 RepID=UPI002151084D|nr:MFS transporter [Hymenobacter sp. J193]MCR5887684.1 MFS transporter [Hymenobacter sp. J193]